MEFCQYVLSLLVSEAFKIGPAQGLFIYLSVNEGELSCIDLDFMGFSSVIRQFPRTQIVGYWGHPRRTRLLYFIHSVGSDRRLWMVVHE